MVGFWFMVSRSLETPQCEDCCRQPLQPPSTPDSGSLLDAASTILGAKEDMLTCLHCGHRACRRYVPRAIHVSIPYVDPTIPPLPSS